MDLEKFRSLSQPLFGAPAHYRLLASGALLALLGAGAAISSNSETPGLPAAQTDHLEALQTAAEALALDSPAQVFTREERIRNGDTVSAVLNRLGVTESDTQTQLVATPGTEKFFSQLSPGKTLTAQTDTQGRLRRLSFPLNGGEQVIQIERDEKGFHAARRNPSLEHTLTLKTAEIRSSLFGATDAAGIPDSIATQLAEVFGGDIDFYRDLRKGDRFSVIYQTTLSDGRLTGTGKVLAAEFVNGGKQYQALWFEDTSGKGAYYTPEGRSLRKAFLRSPLEFSRVTSGFSNARFHPVLETWRAHRGVDYGAAIGTPVRATADGTVDVAGTQGGYGKVVILRHQGRYSTVYGHLSAFAKGLRSGSRVSQGEIIAYTGASGLASGPHLHYEFRIDGVHQNPLTVALPGAPSLEAHQLGAFQHSTNDALDKLAVIRNSNLSSLE